MNSSDPEVSIIIATYNSRKYLHDCLQAVSNQHTQFRFEVLLVDNASTDDTTSYIHTHFPEVHVLKLSENLGFAASNNQAARMAKGKCLIFLNPDTVVARDWLDELILPLVRETSVGATSPKTLLFSDKTKVQNAGIGIFKQGYARDRGAVVRNATLDFETDSSFFDKQIRVHACCGASLAIKRSLFEKVGGFPEQYFLYYEDVDLSIRVQLAGYDCVYVPTATMLHHHGGSKNSSTPTFLFFSERAQLFFVTTFFPISCIASSLSRYVLSTLKALLYSIRGKHWQSIASARLRVLVSFILHVPILTAKHFSINQEKFQKLYETYY